jgi:hypothetical protein
VGATPADPHAAASTTTPAVRNAPTRRMAGL